ncbi:MAG: DUF4410 domain-containing protein, partial [Candidatus Tectomicrobia bacterium]|nr:DUF4410 domain-containing protein [Candidatus Tectomicrobia bacterium]
MDTESEGSMMLNINLRWRGDAQSFLKKSLEVADCLAGKRLLALQFLCFLVLAAGCAAGKPMVVWEKGVSLAEYQTFEVAPVTNEEGKTFDFDVASAITAQIKSKLKKKGYLISEGTETTGRILVVKSSLIAYEPGSALQRFIVPGWGTTSCTVKASLIDKPTGKIVGEMVIDKFVSTRWPYSIGADKRILGSVAA